MNFLSLVSLFLLASCNVVVKGQDDHDHDHDHDHGDSPPVIFDTDYGPFIDDVFALGLLINSGDLFDLKLILTTSEQPDLSAKCVLGQLELSNRTDIDVAIGSTFPPYEDRGSVCAIPGALGFGIEPECQKYMGKPPIEDGVAYMADMIMNSDRDDWWYLVVGGQTSLKALIELYPDAAAKIDTLVVMAGNFCADFDPYPNVTAPTDETNIGCDPAAANFNLDANNIQFNHVYYVPVVVADEIGGEDYKVFVDAAATDPAANATLAWYKIWSEASRADPDLLVHAEAMTYDPETESTPQFDPVALMLALELLSDNCEENRITLVEMDGIHFFENTDPGLQPFPEAPRSAFSLHTGVGAAELPATCPNISSFVFDVEETPELEYPVMVALGFASDEAKAAVYQEMAYRMAGQQILCGVEETMDVEADGGDGSTDLGGTEGGGDEESASSFSSLATSGLLLLILSFTEVV